MSNITDILDELGYLLNNPKSTTKQAISALAADDGSQKPRSEMIELIVSKNPIGDKNMTKEEKKIKMREYFRNYMREYKKTYVQPEHNKSHNAKRRRKYGTALITSARLRKKLAKQGLTVSKNCYIIKEKEKKDETQD